MLRKGRVLEMNTQGLRDCLVAVLGTVNGSANSYVDSYFAGNCKKEEEK